MRNKAKPTFVLELLDNKLTIYRDMQLDAIKVAARSDDQANSACNIVKKLYYYFGWLVQREISAYVNSEDDSSEKINLSDRKERDRMSDIIFNVVFNHNEIPIDEKEHEFLEPWSRYLTLNKWVKIIMYHIGAYAGPHNSDLAVQDSIDAINDMVQEIRRLTSGYNPYSEQLTVKK